jgi:NADPH-dependent 7-cyano-7-deazaguanine reductase QueF
VKIAQPKEDIFERITEYIIDRLEPKMEHIKALYLEKRTIHMVTEKALEGIQEL